MAKWKTNKTDWWPNNGKFCVLQLSDFILQNSWFGSIDNKEQFELELKILLAKNVSVWKKKTRGYSMFITDEFDDHILSLMNHLVYEA